MDDIIGNQKLEQENAKHHRDDNHSWGSGSNSQWQQWPIHAETHPDQGPMEAHNRVISHLLPVGEQLPMEVSVAATPIIPFLEPETPAVPQKMPQPLP